MIIKSVGLGVLFFASILNCASLLELKKYNSNTFGKERNKYRLLSRPSTACATYIVPISRAVQHEEEAMDKCEKGEYEGCRHLLR